MKRVILGNGGYSKTFQDIAEQLGYEILAVLDDKDEQYLLASFTSFISDDTEFIPAFGNNETFTSLNQSIRLLWICFLECIFHLISLMRSK